MRSFCLLLGLAACAPPVTVMPPPPPVEPPLPTRVTLAPVDGTRPVVSTVMSSVSAQGLSLVGGNVAVVASDRVTVRSGTTMSPVPVGVTGSEALGSVRLITRRGASGLLVTSSGVFQDVSGRLLRSPLSDSLPFSQVQSIDGVGTGADEAWWVRTESSLLRVFGGAVDELELTDPNGSGVLSAVVARSATVALVVKGERLYLVDVAAKSVAVLAKGVGSVTATARLGDGHLVFLTSQGLLRVSPQDEVVLLSLGGATLVDLWADGDAALVQTTTQLLSVLGDQVKVLGDVAAPVRSGLVRDAAGAIFTLDGASLKRLATTPEEQPVTFADVKPFFMAHCTSCHASGANYATVIDFTNYQRAKEKAAPGLARIKNADTPMPPAPAALLRQSQYQVLERWVQGGFLP